ncbi:MAG TPA: LamG domain-containing protein [Kofleriaceae bacterium]|nr:LamG domain-containing protein [Kofleriaceae bacterium]
MLACALAACGFRARPGADSTADAGPPFCDPDDPHLIACYELEGDTHDGSSHHLDATMTHVTFPDGKIGRAMQCGADSAVDVPDSALLDVATLTVEAWIHPSQLPVLGARAGILDVDRQFGLFLHPGGLVTCGVASILAMPTTVTAIPLDRWTHVACTYDGESAVLYLDGAAVGSQRGTTIATNGATGISIAADNPPGSGSHLIGLIDQVRLLDVARTAAEICADAGMASCP